MSDEPKCGPCADGRPCADHPRPPVSDQTPTPNIVCRSCGNGHHRKYQRGEAMEPCPHCGSSALRFLVPGELSPELAKAPGVHDGKRTEPCLCTSDDSGSSHDAQHPGEYLNDYGDWEECGWCGGRGFRYADCTRCDGSSFEPADPPAPLPDTGDGRPAEIRALDDAFEGWRQTARRVGPDAALAAAIRPLLDWPTPAPSPSQPEPGTLINCSKTAFRTENHDPHEHRFEGDATAWCRGLDVPALRTPTASADGEPDQPEWDCTEGDHDGLLAYSENTIAPDGSWSFHARGYGDHPDGWEAVADRVSEAHWPAPPAVPGDRPATDEAPAMHVIRRADGDEMGEFAFFATDGPDGWEVAENTDHDEDTVYEILACYPVARRKMLCSTLCPTCDGEGEDGIGTMCPSCGGSGEHEAPDAEHLMIHVYADAQPAHPAPDGDELRNLRRWKSEATTVLDTWDKVHEALGSPGLLGEHKSAASLAEIERRTAAMRQLIDDIAPPGGYGVADGTAT